MRIPKKPTVPAFWTYADINNDEPTLEWDTALYNSTAPAGGVTFTFDDLSKTGILKR